MAAGEARQKCPPCSNLMLSISDISYNIEQPLLHSSCSISALTRSSTCLELLSLHHSSLEDHKLDFGAQYPIMSSIDVNETSPIDGRGVMIDVEYTASRHQTWRAI